MVSTICSGHPSVRAAAASFSMTCSLFFSLFLAVSMRHQALGGLLVLAEVPNAPEERQARREASFRP
jgi:hypothetical protein